ncbi:hypothetical protein C8R43DRAFT_952779 [Mycena crocata]|nr:hypothetical protein C8R43DRAFT_965292 [Mycena crocata]KAJ7148172.1 hypothetical protein C8R43DRAFT_952779 [Mycena crocata]
MSGPSRSAKTRHRQSPISRTAHGSPRSSDISVSPPKNKNRNMPPKESRKVFTTMAEVDLGSPRHYLDDGSFCIAATNASIAPLRRSRRQHQKAPRTDVEELRHLSTRLGEDSLCSAYRPFLAQLQLVADRLHPGTFTVHENVVSWIDATERDDYAHLFVIDEWGLLNKWRRSPVPTRISVILFKTASENPVGHTRDAWSDQEFHMWAALVFHAPMGRNGKALAVWDCNTPSLPSGSRLRDALKGRAKPMVDHLLGLRCRTDREKQAHGSKRAKLVFVNRPHTEENRDGDCVRMTLEFLENLVQEGITPVWGTREWLAVPGFQRLTP